jgi:hypothetical protein
LAGPLKSPAVVRFLCDNTLGRIWHGMRHGDTRLSDVCKYLVHVSDQANERSADGLEKKDPRDIRVIDPACGSGHFLLYCFLLLLIIYEEAWRIRILLKAAQQVGRCGLTLCRCRRLYQVSAPFG